MKGGQHSPKGVVSAFGYLLSGFRCRPGAVPLRPSQVPKNCSNTSPYIRQDAVLARRRAFTVPSRSLYTGLLGRGVPPTILLMRYMIHHLRDISISKEVEQLILSIVHRFYASIHILEILRHQSLTISSSAIFRRLVGLGSSFSASASGCFSSGREGNKAG